MADFMECASCAAKPGAPTLCPSCLHNRAQIAALMAECDRANARAAREEQATLAALADADEQRARAEAAEHTFRCVEESEQYLALLKLAEAEKARATKAEAKATQYERDWYDAKAEFGQATAKVQAARAAAEARAKALEEALREAAKSLRSASDRWCVPDDQHP